MLACVESSAKSLAIDVFDDQERNVDRSGRGVREIFENNLKKHCESSENVTVRQMDSLAIRSKEVIDFSAQFLPFRFFSVDGGHTPIHALNDIIVAQELTANGGVIIVDDIFHPDWPGVTEAVYRYLSQENAKYVPLCIAGQKLYLTAFGFAEPYLRVLAEDLKRSRPNSFMKTVSVHGHRCLSFHLHEADPVIN